VKQSPFHRCQSQENEYLCDTRGKAHSLAALCYVWQAHVKIFTAQKGKLLLAKKHGGL